MTAYTDDDVHVGADALRALVMQHPLTGGEPWDAAIGEYGAPNERDLVAAVLTAVAPAIAARAEIVGIEKALARVDRYQAEHDAEVAARALREAANVDCDYCRTTKACDAYRRGRADALREAADEWTDDSPMATGVALSAKRRNKMMRALKDVGWCAWYRPPIVASWLRARAEQGSSDE